MKYIIITGGVISGLGKGITVSSIGLIFNLLGYTPTAIKIDPYLNIDAGTMSPYEHGEVFVLKDGGETDLDLGNYERFMNIDLTQDSNITTGKIYHKVITKERKGDFLGKTIQVIPHITNEIKDWIKRVAHNNINGKTPDICIIELGGTIGDIESMPFIEALRQLQMDVGKENCCFGHISMIPTTTENEQKTKPTQHSIQQLRSYGINADFLFGRSKDILESSVINKLSMFCQVDNSNIFTLYDVDNILKVPVILLEQNFNKNICKRFNFNSQININYQKKWNSMIDIKWKNESPIIICIIGKYIGLKDSYLSLISALKHASYYLKIKIEIIWIDAEELEITITNKHLNILRECHGIIVPGGFGDRGIEGKKIAINYARNNNKPFLGICLGMQLSIIEKLESLYNKKIYSEEFQCDINIPWRENAIIYMPHSTKDLGGSMRLGNQKVIVKPNTLAFDIYSSQEIIERHRHRYEVNPKYISTLEKNGYIFSGTDISETRMEIVEISKYHHKFFLATQFHPEYLSRPLKPSLIFTYFLQSCII